MLDFSEYKGRFTTVAGQVINELNKIEQLSDLKIENKNVTEIMNDVHGEVVDGVRRIRFDLDSFIANVGWNTLNIGFFGETNAGKSTLIEAICCGDGNSIGDGRKDFTKEIRPTNINGIMLYDMPGIEGKEDKFVQEIKEAVNKCHAIFYILGANKEPEVGTMEKVREYLGRQASMYYIVNIRSKVSAYRIRKNLADDNLQIVIKRTEKKMRNILGGFVKGGLFLNAHLAFVASGKPSRSDLVSERNKAAEIFGSLEKAREFSQIDHIQKLLGTLQEKASKEIIVNNTYKFMRALEDVTSSILNNKKKFDEQIRLLRDESKKARSNIDILVTRYHEEINLYVQNRLKSLESDFKDVLNECIENDTPKEIEPRINGIRVKYSKEIEEKVKEKIMNLGKSIENELEKFKIRIELYNRIGNFQGDLDFSAILNKLKLGLKQILGEIIDIGISIVSIIELFAIHPLIGIAATLVAIARKVWGFFFGGKEKRKREAQQKAINELEKQLAIVRKNINRELQSNIRKIKVDVSKQLNQVEDFFRILAQINNRFNDIIQNIGKLKTDLSIIFVRYISNAPVEIAFIDVKLEKMVVVGGERCVTINPEEFGLKQVFYYPSISKFTKDLGPISHGYKSVLTYQGNEEILFRAACACKQHLNIHIVKRGKAV